MKAITHQQILPHPLEERLTLLSASVHLKTISSVVSGPAASMAPGNLLEMQSWTQPQACWMKDSKSEGLKLMLQWVLSAIKSPLKFENQPDPLIHFIDNEMEAQ